jgi:hypothetical protein
MALSSKNIRTLGNIVKNLEIEKYKCEMFTNYGHLATPVRMSKWSLRTWHCRETSGMGHSE